MSTANLQSLQQAIHAASQRPDVLTAIDELYHDVQTQIDLRRPLCIMSGRCCHFEDFGHRLYVTTLELAAFWQQFQSLPPSQELQTAMQTWTGQGCPFQLAKLCGVHPIRPFGCRIFFCDPTATQWQNDTYELFHTRLKRLHETLNIPYFYVEWRQALQALIPALPATGY